MTNILTPTVAKYLKVSVIYTFGVYLLRYSNQVLILGIFLTCLFLGLVPFDKKIDDNDMGKARRYAHTHPSKKIIYTKFGY